MFTESTSSSISIGSVYTTGSSVRTYRSSSYGNLYVYPNYVSGRSQTTSRTYTTGSSTTTASKATQSEGYAVTFHENRVITIPAKSGKIVDGFSLKYSPYRDCDLYRFPSKKEINKKNFTQENTPLKYKNIITYGFDEKEPASITIEHNFWVSEIANYAKNSFISYDYYEYCGHKLLEKLGYYLYESPSNFFIEYTKTMETIFAH